MAGNDDLDPGRPLVDEMEAALWDVTDYDVDLGEGKRRLVRDQAYASLGVQIITPREPCPICGEREAKVQKVGGQDIARCRRCDHDLHVVPKPDMGEARRNAAPLSTDLKASQRARILERDGCCVICGATEALTIGYGLSWKDAEELGDAGPWLNREVNLFAMCETCSVGLGDDSILPRTYLRVHLRLIQAAELHEAAGRHPANDGLRS